MSPNVKVSDMIIAVQNARDYTLFGPEVTKFMEEHNDDDFSRLIIKERLKRMKAVIINLLIKK